MKRIKKQFWLSEKENADFMKKVELSGLSQSAVLRILIKGYEPVSYTHLDVYKRQDWLSLRLQDTQLRLR